MPSPLQVLVRFDRPEYHGLRTDDSVDWPPSPQRLVGALTFGAHHLASTDREEALAAVSQILQANPPEIHVPSAIALNLPSTFTQRSGLDAPGKSSSAHLKNYLDTSLLAMNTTTRTAKPVDGVTLERSLLVFEIAVELPPRQLEALSLAANQVGYFGRSTDPAEITVWAGDAPVSENEWSSLSRWKAIPVSSGRTRGWTSLSSEWMNENYRRMFQASTSTHVPQPPLPPQGYLRPLKYVRSHSGDSTEILPLDQAVPNHLIPKLFELLSELTSPEPWEKITIFPVVFSGHHHSDGRCMGLGFTGDSPVEVQTVAAEIGVHLWESSLLKLQTGPVPQERASTLSPSNWNRSAKIWHSATPYRGFPDATVIRYQIDQEIYRRFGIHPISITGQMTPHKSWETSWKQSTFADGLVNWWIDIVLPEEIDGPLVLQKNQSLGSGLFAVTASNKQGKHRDY